MKQKDAFCKTKRDQRQARFLLESLFCNEQMHFFLISIFL